MNFAEKTQPEIPVGEIRGTAGPAVCCEITEGTIIGSAVTVADQVVVFIFFVVDQHDVKDGAAVETSPDEGRRKRAGEGDADVTDALFLQHLPKIDTGQYVRCSAVEMEQVDI